MSGIAGIVAADGAPVDAALLDRMAGALAFRGPHGTASWMMGPAGLVHARLRAGDRARDVPQPFTVDGRMWIVADARIDARDELVRALRGAGIPATEDAPAAELILHALRAWGDDAPARLLGDFAFAVWDAPNRRLFCARDLFGVKPFYYAESGGGFAFSNTLDCLRLHPAAGGALDEGWIADFLVHGVPQATDATVYAAIRQLPPAHTLVVGDGRIALRRYAALPLDPEPFHGGVRDAVDAFSDVLRAAVRDRLPDGGAAIFLSGGRDSTALAAVAADTLRRGERTGELRAYTEHYARRMPDEERRYAALAADALGISARFTAADEVAAFAGWDAAPMPEPTDAVLRRVELDQLAEAAAHTRVILTGQGGDPVLREFPSRLTRLATRGHPLRAAREAAQFAWWHRQLPRPGVRSWLRNRGGAPPRKAEVPRWIAPAFAARVGLAERVAGWEAWRGPVHPLRPDAYAMLAAPLWPALFAAHDPGATGVAIEQRHPFFDARVVRLVLSIPPAQWYNDKGLLRIAMRGRLPRAVLHRPKTPLVDDPLEVRWRTEGLAWLGGRRLGAEVARFVDRGIL